ncbi:oligopeptide ABC transporter permease OppB [Candidatus Macondimonas diazotrophica]|uniref:Oligopeptide ABC transporter permease OppB n=1 Tax=Candidatus Macondimonas diazotrophica TaxID=2305248 RepID=A0A4Z0FC30_9GAMM|nr:oligopeptide ABC transporter permease OppB [Candidatus Macondimonas diazotrophica]HBG29981.1 oligopeptide ABC transporter permease OppB [Gammaproteobacteria bacterium]NCU01489.1 oligopeptide ABC transporter permease OppB [Candidatus Macondimonas diazotrophica]TFZ83087.1 oligopeptide ABC transporter permease OppB [Candidatus Macondimonas diazotrophica]HBG50386.1 oligopeptide ABC transporter permease OppB [Gammaproteobacteria bacterium]HCO42733.1 oligopeptide ABC transporter permease OppB [Ga
MLTYSLRRFLGAWPTLLVLVTLSFFLVRAAPGGPFDAEKNLPPEIEANLAAKYHLDEPLWQQYLRYLGDLARGDLGPSFKYADYTVNELIAQGFPVSLRLGLAAMAVALLIGLPAGMLAALRQNRPLDHVTMAAAMTGISVPGFVVAPLLILVFAVHLGWLPAGGLSGGLSAWILPVTALSLPLLAYIARLTRASLIEVWRSPFIRTARAKGLPLRVILVRHALKPTLLPVVSFLGPALAGVITGSVVIEAIFGIPGLGRYFVQGALNRDYTLVMGVVVFYGALIIVFNFLVDLLYALLDPRVRYTA